MKTSDFDYQLPAELIAQTPLEPRDASRLMVLDRGAGGPAHRRFRDLPAHLRPGDLLVGNDSRVLPARLHGRKVSTGGRVELLLLRPHQERVWEALVRPMARMRKGTRVLLEGSGKEGSEVEMVERTEAGTALLRFSTEVAALLDRVGQVPLPPYIKAPLRDAERYQTIFARISGSAAAPTAGLHFTPELIRAVEARGAGFAFVTLHVGWDTFRPVKEERIEDHRMHSEFAEVGVKAAGLINATRRRGGRIVAVGTTSIRALETAALGAGEGEAVGPFRGATDLFIRPGHRFRAVDGVITNFHLPRSTLLMLIAAFAGLDRIKEAYEEAIRRGYRFYSFGDAMLIL